MIFRLGHFVPKFTVDNHPEFATYHGYKGETNRQNVASNFLKPFNWKQYCFEIATEDICASGNDTVAKRLPANEEEEEMFFLQDVFFGHFNATSDSDCTNNSECFGHFIDIYCDSRSFSEAQMFWNNIPMKSKGPIEPNGAYNDDQFYEIILAANWTKSNVFFIYNTPNMFGSSFIDSDFSWFRVQFPEPTEACQQIQERRIVKCTDNELDRIGNNLLYCDYPIERTVKIVSSELKKTHDMSPMTTRSPALDFLQTFRIKFHTMQEIFDEVIRLAIELGKFDDQDGSMYPEKEATCKWLYDHIEEIESDLPKGYPRKVLQKEESINKDMIVITAMVCACVSLCVLLCVSTLIGMNRNKSAILQAQRAFLMWMILGKNAMLLNILCNASY